MTAKKPKEVASKIRLDDLFALAEQQAREAKAVTSGLAKVADACLKMGAKLDVPALAKLPVKAELKRLESWFKPLWSPKAPPAKLGALYFGIVEFDDGVFDFRCEAVHGKSPDTEDWEFGHGRSITPEYAGSKVLAALSTNKSLIGDSKARHIVCLSYVGLVAAHLCKKQQEVLSKRRPLVAAGYDEGDMLSLGRYAAGAFEPPAPAPDPKAVTVPKRGTILHLFDTRGGKAGWMLGSVTGAKELPYEFACTGRRVKPQPLEVPIYLKGRAMDFSFADSVPIVRKHVGDILEQIDGQSIQRLPITVNGTDERFEMVNLLRRVKLDSLLSWCKQHRKPISEAPLGKAHIARVDRMDSVVVISRDLAEMLAKAGVTGTEIVPLEKASLLL